MTQLFIYVLAASKDPDKIHCKVPWCVDEDLIFFGPCKKRLRELLRKNYLLPDKSHSNVDEDIFIVGVNGSNRMQSRKVVWAGKLSEVMTFAEADKRMQGGSFLQLRKHSFSPLHVSPMVENGEFIGYEHVSNEHIDNDRWVLDLVSSRANPNIRVEGRKLILQPGKTEQAFDRDCCMFLKNRFFAAGNGLEFDEEALEILRNAQPGKLGIDRYAIFGRQKKGKGNAEGLVGRYLPITGDLANLFVAWIENRSGEATEHKGGERNGFAKTHCH
ncbi:MAG: hypothetical protein WCW53_14235 [Syntrophales bacterium]